MKRSLAEDAIWTSDTDVLDAVESRLAIKRQERGDDGDDLRGRALPAVPALCIFGGTERFTALSAAAMREACSSQTMVEMCVIDYHFNSSMDRSLMAMHLAFNLQRNRFVQKLVLSMDSAITLAVVGALWTHPTLRSLTINTGEIDIVPALVQLLESNRRIRALHLHGTIQGIGALCQACGTLAELSVANGDVRDDSLFANLIATSQNLRDLCVSNPFGSAAHIALALGQKQTRLRSLDVARCGFKGRSAALHFVSMLETSNFI